jgi:hypothetical protein
MVLVIDDRSCGNWLGGLRLGQDRPVYEGVLNRRMLVTYREPYTRSAPYLPLHQPRRLDTQYEAREVDGNIFYVHSDHAHILGPI